MPDTQVNIMTANLLECLRVALEANPNPPDNYCRRVEWDVTADLGPSTGAPMTSVDDLCCEGLGYVTVGEIWPSSASFPEQDIIRQIQGNCPPPAWAVQVRAGVIRCVNASLRPSCAEEEVDFVQDLHDAQAIRAAFCCFRTYLGTAPYGLGMSVVVERQSKTVQGGCKNRYALITIQFLNCDC